VPSYEKASSRISLFQDKRMRNEAVSFAVRRGNLVLDLGAGPGTMSKVVVKAGGDPVLLDASRVMLKASGFPNAVLGIFEFLPFRDEVFDGAVSGFAVRDSHELPAAVAQLNRVLKAGGRFALCDLGKPDGLFSALVIGMYLRIMPSLIGLATTGRAGLRYGSLFDTYVLVLRNSELKALLNRYIGQASIHETQLGGSIVAKCIKENRNRQGVQEEPSPP
jgi:demethylmenaquinone methyltransferase/2-methoxy-6-polyprenyl-1,4-benzoquinol methylase